MIAFLFLFFFFFNDTATTEIYTLSLHDALPIFGETGPRAARGLFARRAPVRPHRRGQSLRRSEDTRLNSSHVAISYAVFCLKKKKPGRSISGSPRSRRRAMHCWTV